MNDAADIATKLRVHDAICADLAKRMDYLDRLHARARRLVKLGDTERLGMLLPIISAETSDAFEVQRELLVYQRDTLVAAHRVVARAASTEGS